MNPIGMAGVLADLRGLQSKLTGMAGATTPQAVAADAGGGNGSAGGGTGSFATLLRQSIGEVEASQRQADQLSTGFEQGKPGASLPQVMIAVEKANLTFDGMVQVRNKLVDAYNQVMDMQV